ncbi:MAG: hypothetical protein WC565_05070 [Parcubacteria group bacterium]
MKKSYPNGAVVVRISDGTTLARKSSTETEDDYGTQAGLEEQAEDQWEIPIGDPLSDDTGDDE